MTNNKKLLLIFRSLLIIGSISTGISFLLNWIFPVLPFWGLLILITILQFPLNTFLDRYSAYRESIGLLREYAAKPFRKYNIALNCSYCGKETPVDVELTDTTFKCGNCQRTNALYITFMPAAMNTDK